MSDVGSCGVITIAFIFITVEPNGFCGEQVELAEKYGTQTAALREEQARLRAGLQDVQERLQRTGKDGKFSEGHGTGDQHTFM